MAYVVQPHSARGAAAVGDVERRRLSSRALLICAGLFVLAAVISGFTILQGIEPFDEGLVLQAARRVAQGQVPYRDFTWAYGPAQPYLLAVLIKLFGVSLVDWRVLRSLADAGVALTAYLLVRRRMSPGFALLTFIVVAFGIAEPRNANPLTFSLLAVLIALWLVTGRTLNRRRLVAASLLTAVAAAFRLDIAIYGLLAVGVTLALSAGMRTALAYAAGAMALTLLVYLPFAILDGPASLYHALVGISLSTGAYWSLPFPFVYHAPVGAGIAKTVKHAIDFYVPLFMVIGYAAMVLDAAQRWRRVRRPPELTAGLIVFGAGLLAYLLSRTDDVHAQPLLVVVAIGLALSAVSAPRPLAGLCVVVLAILLVHGVANRLSALFRPPAETTLHVAVADGVMAPPAEARAIERMVALVDAEVPPGQPIYVLPRRSDLVRFADPLIYVLAERDNPTSADFGLLTGAAAQMQIVRTLSRVKPRILVRWTDPVSSQRERNLRGHSSGVHTLDRWVAIHYRPLAVLYHYEVLITRG